MSATEYLRETEFAIRQLFDSLRHYNELLEEAVNPIFICDAVNLNEIERDKAFEEWLAENEEELSVVREKQKEFFGKVASQGTICGSIIQIAFMGIKSHSPQTSLPAQYQRLLNSDDDRYSFCIGREVRNVPLGLIIYAARNQYNHMDVSLKNILGIKVFDELATHQTGSKYKDPAFDLNNSDIENYAHNIIGIMGWDSYEKYFDDMEQMIVQQI